MAVCTRIASATFAGIVALSASAALAVDVPIAVAANFTDAANEIGKTFEAKTGNKAVFSFGATGALYTQITQGAPFQVFLSADQATAKKAIDEGNGVAGSQFTYAVGKIVLYSKNAALVKGADTLKTATFQKVAIANPPAAPYGAAAVEAMTKMGVYAAVQPKLVLGDTITQTYQFIDTGNAELGFVALSQVINVQGGSRWLVDDALYTPIRQDVVITKVGANAAAAKAFVDFLKTPEAIAIIEKFGYGKG
ncbi:MAG: molybdate ABC transporter substrate-binding protein [Alphaproteobacteria bacterium]|nr:molybdate ABC transporter substrate-binding protein [Alphaproteobacteria bacterium]